MRADGFAALRFRHCRGAVGRRAGRRGCRAGCLRVMVAAAVSVLGSVLGTRWAIAQASVLQSPVRIALAPSGNLLVSDYLERAIVTLEQRTGEVVRAFPVAGRPLGIAWYRGRFYVGNEATARVEVYDRMGGFLYALEGTIAQPNDIAVDNRRGVVFVTATQEGTVEVFDAHGAYLYAIPAVTTDEARLVRPTGIALDREREQVIVSDFGDPAGGREARVQIYDYAGNYVRGISGEAGTSEFQFSRPQGVAVDGAGRVFVVDSLLGQVLVFDGATGAGLKILGSFGTEPGQLFLPLDVALDAGSGDVFVTNNRLGRVEVFRGGAGQ